MSILRKTVIAAVAVSAILAAPTAALASTGQHAVAPAAAPAKVHRAPCTGLTFNVYHDHTARPLCYAGTGTARPNIPAVNQVTTGRYWGCLTARAGTAVIFRGFRPRMVIGFTPPVKLVSLELATHPVPCPASPTHAAASASTVNSSQDSIVEPTGGMVAASASPAGVPSPNVTSAKVPSCGRITYRGNAGAIHVQTNSRGYLQWGIYMYNPKLDDGRWKVSVYVANKKVDGKNQDYAPHASLRPEEAKKGKIFHITATHHADANGNNYGSVPNECIIP
jgi:hypothetical protein